MRFWRRRADRLTHGVTAKVIKLEIRNWLLTISYWLLAVGTSTPIALMAPIAPITLVALANSNNQKKQGKFDAGALQ